MLIKDIQIIKENIDMDPDTSDLFRSFSGLMKTNNGIFKSSKQRDFLLKKVKARQTPYTGAPGQTTDTMPQSETNSLRASYFGVQFNEDQGDKYIMTLRGSIRWANYGHSTRDVGWVFIFDDNGVKRQYKLKWKESTHIDPRTGQRRRGAATLDSAGTKLLWERPANADTTELNKPVPKTIDDMRTHGSTFGEVGQRYKDVMLIVESSFGPLNGTFGSYYVNKLRDQQGNLILYFGPDVGPRDKIVTCTFTVGRHDVDKKTNEPVTIIKRPKFPKEAAPPAEPEDLPPSEND